MIRLNIVRPQPQDHESAGPFLVLPALQGASHQLRKAVKDGDDEKIKNSYGDPGELSRKRQHNALHKLALARNPDPKTAEFLLGKVDEPSRGGLASAQDKNGNTPLHYIQARRGKLAGDGKLETEGGKLTDLYNLLGEPARSVQRDNLKNVEGKTPDDLSQEEKIRTVLPFPKSLSSNDGTNI